MPKSSSQTPDRVIPEPEVQGGFMFVALTGKKDQAKDNGARKKLRAHVMHNFRDKETKTNGGRKGSEDSGDQSRKTSPAKGGQKMRFRLKENGKLEESVPLRQRRRRAERKQDEERDIEELVEQQPQEGQALPDPDFEAWSRQYFRQYPILEPDLQPDFQLPSLLSTTEKPQFKTVTEGYFDDKTLRNFWEDVEVDYSLTPSVTALEQVRLPTSPLLAFGVSRLDPFNVLPFAISRRDEELIDRFQHYEMETWCPVNGRGIWFAYAMQDEPLFHATFYHWGMHFENKVAEFHLASPEILGHKLSSFRMINQRLSSGDQTVTYETLAAVAALVNVEIGFGSVEEATKHMRGLETMIEMIGGIERLKGSMDGVLQRFIGWIDLNYAELLGTKTQMMFAKDCNYSEKDVCLSTSTCFRRSISGIDYGPLVWQKLQGDVINLLHEVRILCEDVNARPFRGLQERERVRRSDAFHDIERKLKNLTVVEEETAILETPSDRMWRATALAGSTYIHYMLRMLPLEYQQFNSLSRDLQTALALTGGPRGIWKNAPEILVWALTTGTIISERRIEHGWYVERLASACREVGYTSWDRYRQKMESFLWIERLDNVRYKKVWDQVELLL
jgi:Fungal specific transcription factor domain